MMEIKNKFTTKSYVGVHYMPVLCSFMWLVSIFAFSLLWASVAVAQTSATESTPHSVSSPASNGEEQTTFSIVLLPDTQVYSEKYPEVFIQQTEWIKENAKRINCRFVVHEGDIVQRPDNEDEWKVANKAMSVLDGVVPYCFAVGDNDMPTQLYNKHFPVKRFQKEPWYGGHFGENNDNTYHCFKASGLDFMIVCLQHNPSSEILAWANEVVSKHPEHRVLLATHSFINSKEFTPQGAKIWKEFAKKHKNIFLVVCGHLPVGQRKDKGDHGNAVHSLCADYQRLENGGNGWLRILTFVPEKDIIQVRTYSTRLKKFFGQGDGKYSTPQMNNFELKYDMNSSSVLR